jgi:hypothetical protein
MASKDSSIITARDSSGKLLYSGTNAAAAIQVDINAIRGKADGGTLHINAGIYIFYHPKHLGK